ncbi:unnamed protein product [Ceutorhynchus assimilis]|uniref:Ras-GEF domain-containing protein n=1 Tax=Ceutorhynchus assimilis TaxID=467358 RepID=A0A9N9QMP3_9CUCU|nr:unnamed protein product [Ceutorhynchus assimilis]
MHKPRPEEFLKVKKRKIRSQPPEHFSQIHQRNLNFGDSVQVNRFASGVYEGCNTGLYLTVDDYVTPVHYDAAMTTTTLTESVDWDSVDYEEIAETAVLIWEYFGVWSQRNRLRHRRRCGFAPKSLFLYGLGPWHTSSADEYSLHLNKAVSTVNLTVDSGSTLPVSQQHLVASISCPEFTSHNEYNFINAPKKPLILFWTPGYWYKPVTARDAYIEQQKYLKKIRDNQEKYSKRKLKCLGKRPRKFFKKFRRSHYKDNENGTDNETVKTDRKKRKTKFISNLLGTNNKLNEDSLLKRPNETTLQHLKRLLAPGNSLTAWDFDSTTLAQQLTLLDKELFLKISSDELRYILWQRSTKNAPNVTAMVSFSYRIACLIGSEILRGESEKVRARLVARFIIVADKCHRMSNFHSCKSVLGGLQSPPIFRLRQTWAYARKKHASTYQVFEYLCRLYRDPRMPIYQKTFLMFSQRPPYLPSIGHIVAKLLNKLPEYKIQTLQSRQLSSCASKISIKSKTPNNNCRENNFFTKIFNFISPPPKTMGAGDEIRPNIKPQGLHTCLKQTNCHEDTLIDSLQGTTEFLEKSQLGAVHYNFSINQMAREFLLKARYFEDEHNFFNSLSLEDNKTK